jgi:hypothetical protein
VQEPESGRISFALGLFLVPPSLSFICPTVLYSSLNFLGCHSNDHTEEGYAQ